MVNQWTWNTNNDFCPICRNSVNEASIVMENDPDCCSHIVIGTCGHAFHYDCIEKWLKTSSKVCPLCNTQWVYKTKTQLSDQSTSIESGLPPLPNINVNENATNLITQTFNMPSGLSVSSNNNQTWANIAESNNDSWGPSPEPVLNNNNDSWGASSEPVLNNNNTGYIDPPESDNDSMPDLIDDYDSMPELEEDTPLIEVISEPIMVSNSNIEESIVNDSDDEIEIVD